MTSQEESPAMKAFGDALIKKRKEMYGDLWDKVDWWGIPNRDLPEEERQAILAELRKKRNEAFEKRRKP